MWVTTALRHASDWRLPLPLVARLRWRTLGVDVAFNTLTFMLFFAVILAVHQLPLSWRARKRNLLIASYVFYSAWNPPLILLLWISTAIDWWAAQRIAASSTRVRRRRFLFASLSANLGLLFFFKYGDFLVENFTLLMKLLGVSYQPAAPNIVLPLGISFYTFQTLSYTIDIYGEAEALAVVPRPRELPEVGLLGRTGRDDRCADDPLPRGTGHEERRAAGRLAPGLAGCSALHRATAR